MSPRRTLTSAAAVAAVAACTTTACGNGADVAISRDFNAGDGMTQTKGQVRVLNALVVAPPQRDGAAVLSMRIVGLGGAGDKLLRVTVGGASTAFTGTTTLTGRGALSVGGPDATTQITTTGGGAPVAGTASRISMLWQRAGTLDVTTTVVSADGYYAGITASPTSAPSTPGVVPTPEPTTTGPASPTAGPTPTQSSIPTPSRNQGTGGSDETVSAPPS